MSNAHFTKVVLQNEVPSDNLTVTGAVSAGSVTSGTYHISGIVRHTADGALTLNDAHHLVDFAFDVTGSTAVTLPAAKVGRHLRMFWSVEQQTSDRVLTALGSDKFVGKIMTSVEGNAAGDGDVVSIPNTTSAITTVDDVNIGSHIDLHCAVDGLWQIIGHFTVEAVGSVPTLA